MSKLEPEYAEPFGAWKKNPTPQTRSALLKSVRPAIDLGIKGAIGQTDDPVLKSRAKSLALKAFETYDPEMAGLNTHLSRHMQGLRRQSRQRGQILQVPERVLLQQAELERYEQEFRDEKGREATLPELADRTGLAPGRIQQVRNFQPGVSAGAYKADGGSAPGIDPSAQASKMWAELIYDDLGELDKQIMALSLGFGGKKPMSNQDIASKLGRSPGAISQRKAKIQALLDEESELSPFLN